MERLNIINEDDSQKESYIIDIDDLEEEEDWSSDEEDYPRHPADDSSIQTPDSSSVARRDRRGRPTQ